ncbi:YciI family protein [Actinokineospora sp. NBRC 105648]|uniref:YciI family protein n=1 Tax=Actinokineospora sp. NBRC 105648 TaxID=3032206 RepID=UPI0024A3BCF6|nr:YciI family protein [Actinokineospora sp. NBRC 105648]GLZ38162.1 transcription initiation protein [Actinokineospora sp. NBRC 105648]
MRYLMLIAGRAEDYADADMSGCAAWSAEMTRRGLLLSCEGLVSPEEATTVRVRDGEVLLTDGPFAETKDQIGGYALLECATRAEAVEVAAKHPAAAVGMLEVRPIE